MSHGATPPAADARPGAPLARAAAATLALLLAAATVRLAADSRHAAIIPEAFGTVVVGLSCVGAGIVAWSRRPENRTGRLLVIAGLAWLVGGTGVAQDPVVFTVGLAVSNLSFALFVQLILAYPSGRLETAGARRLALAAWILGTVVWLAVVLLLDPTTAGCTDCPENLLRAVDAGGPGRLLGDLYTVAVLVVVLLCGATMLARFRAASAPLRRALAPVFLAAGATVVVYTAIELINFVDHEAADAGWVVFALTLASVPLGFLAGLLRERLFRSAAVAELVTGLGAAVGPAELERRLGAALRDPSLRLAFWLPEHGRHVGVDGHPWELPAEGAGQVATVVRHEGAEVAVIAHDASLCDDPTLLEAVGGAASLALERARLETELRLRLDELRASRLRIVQAGYEARRRIERDLHDGAQQRLVSLALTLNVLRGRLADDPTSLRLLENASEQLRLGLAELRELARGIHPAVLTEHGLRPALASLAARSSVPVACRVRLDERLPAPVEAAAYFVVSEALANVDKYARASSATVEVDREDGHALVEVVDDGVGGADAERGSGLRGLRDRVEALDGRLEVTSAPGAGTCLRAEIPLG